MAAKQPTPQQLAFLTGIANRVIKCHAAQVELIKRDLQNFDIPAQRSINAGFNRMGIDRFTKAGDDVWEMVTTLESKDQGWEYTRPPRNLIDRWACA